MNERATVTVLGLRTLGAPLALALKGGGRFAQVVAWDADFDVARRGQKGSVADRFVASAPEAVRQAAAVFVAVPAESLREVLVATGPHLRPGTVVCLVEEGQERALALAAEVLPGNVSAVAAHPLLWERPAPEAPPSATLFRGGVLCLATSPAAHPDAVAYLASLAETLEMAPYFLDAREHDAFAAGVGRLPSVLAAAYLRVAGGQRSWRELGRVAGGELRGLGALVEVDAEEGQQALAATSEHLVRWIDELVAELTALRESLQGGTPPADYYQGAQEIWRKWQHTRQQPPGADELPAPPQVPKRRFLF